MPTFDQLPAEQKAIIELVVQRGRSYDDLADALGITPARVRELGRDALVELSPRSAGRVDPERLPQLADFVLGQQTEAEVRAAKSHLRRSEAARMWVESLLDSLEHMYEAGKVPEVPEAGPAEERPRRRERERGREREREREREPARRERARDRGERDRVRDRERVRVRDRERPRRDAVLSPEAETAVRNRRIAATLGALLLVAAVTAGLILLIGGGDDDDGGGKEDTQRQAAQPKIVGQLLLNPREKGSRSQGIAIVAERGGSRDLIVQARLDPTKQGQAYEVWLYNSDKDAVSVGAQVTDRDGNYQGAGKLPARLDRYKFIDVSLEKIDNNAAHSGNSVLRGAVADIRQPTEGGAGGATGQGGAQPQPGQPGQPGQAP